MPHTNWLSRRAIAVTFAVMLGAAACSPNTVAPSASAPAASSNAAASGRASATGNPSPFAVTFATRALNGVYRWTITTADALTYGTPEDKTPEGLAQYPTTSTVALMDGTWASSGPELGTYTVSGDRLVLNYPAEDESSSWTFSVDQARTLHLAPVPPITDPGGVFVTSTKPWTRIGDASAADMVRALNGTFRYTITKEDALAHGLPTDKTPEALASDPSTTTVTFKNGRWDSKGSDGGSESGTFTVNQDRLAFDWPHVNSVLTFTFTFSADTGSILKLTPVLPMDPGDQFVWSTEPWTKIQ